MARMTSTTTARDVVRDTLENQFGLADRVVDESSLANSVARFRERGRETSVRRQTRIGVDLENPERAIRADVPASSWDRLWKPEGGGAIIDRIKAHVDAGTIRI